MIAGAEDQYRIVITGIGCRCAQRQQPAPSSAQNLLAGRSGVTQLRHPLRRRDPGRRLPFDELRHQKKKDVRRGTRAGSIGIYCAHEAIADAGLDWPNVDKSTRRHLHRRHRARQRRDRERDLSSSRASTTTPSSGRTTTTRARWPTTRPARSR